MVGGGSGDCASCSGFGHISPLSLFVSFSDLSLWYFWCYLVLVSNLGLWSFWCYLISLALDYGCELCFCGFDFF